MLAALDRNQRSSHSEGLSVQEVDVGLDEGSLRSYLLGREVFFETEYLALRRADAIALVAVGKEPIDALFARVVELRVLAHPDEVAWVDAPETDTSNGTALALAARTWPSRRPRLPDPGPLQPRQLHLGTGAPPRHGARRGPARAAEAVHDGRAGGRLRHRAAADRLDARRGRHRRPPALHPAPRYLLQCRGSGVDLGTPTDFLDTIRRSAATGS